LVIIGSSTGGPKALQAIFQHLPFRCDTALLVVQHMPPGFTRSLANRLNQLSKYTIKEGEHEELVSGGMVYIAPGGQHMVLDREGERLKIVLNTDLPRRGHRPSIDVLLESLKVVKQEMLICAILTGMGKDGMEGLKRLKQSHRVYTIAEDESSCVVYGMPKAVIEAGLADRVVPIDQVAVAMMEAMKKMGGSNRWT
jgi:two-component system chemotaxis response regulator CheB